MSEQTSFTPGPWRVSGNRREVYAKDPNGFTGPFVVADCSGREPFGPLTTAHPAWVSEANARLIAAAPELLSALRGLAESIAATSLTTKLDEFVQRDKDIAWKVIAKAEGRTNV